jgi:hypothetical protein
MKNIKKVAAGIIVGAALTSAPLLAFAAPAFADTGAAKPVADGPSHMNIPPWGFNGSAREQHVLVNSTSTGQSNASHVLVNAASAGSLRDGNAARCGGGINC